MRRISFRITVGAAALLAVAAGALATPSPNSAVIVERVFNDCPGSTLTTSNSYPGQIIIDDVNTPGCIGFANLHVWRFSENGSTSAVFGNCDAFRFCADLLITGTGDGNAGLQIQPWWNTVFSPTGEGGDGLFNIKTKDPGGNPAQDGEIACFAGRLPFYSFTSSHGLHYVKGSTIHLEAIYLPPVPCTGPFPPNTQPATIEYKVTYNSTNYTSGPLPFDMGNPAEEPPHGLWGILDQVHVGGHEQFFVGLSGLGSNFNVAWSNICFEGLLVAVEEKTWATVKGMYR
jgi:hypothetical protein